MGQVFISYRRDDHAGYVRAVLSEIKGRFGEGQAFLDLEDIDAGADFSAVIEGAIVDCEVLLVMIGPNWLAAKGLDGRSRLYDPDDFVRREILTAFQHQIPVIPVLVDDAVMPDDEDLPAELERLTHLQAVPLSNTRWDSDIEKLFAALERVTEEPRLAREYLAAERLAHSGHWRDALLGYCAIVARRPNFRDVAERLRPLKELDDSLRSRGTGEPGWRQTAVRFPIVSMLLVSLPPNLLAAVFNYVYNERLIVMPLQQRGIPEAEESFWLATVVANGVAFPVGIACFAWAAWPVRKALAKCLSVVAVPPGELQAARTRLLHLPQVAAFLGAGLWLAAGPVYPLIIGAMGWPDYAHFVLSLLFCGLIASAYPYFGMACLCLRVIYPRLAQPGSTSAADEASLERLDRRRWYYLTIAGALPILAITVAVLLGPLRGSPASAGLLGILGVSGIVGLVAVIGCFRLIQSDLDVLRRLVQHSTAVRVDTGSSPVN